MAESDLSPTTVQVTRWFADLYVRPRLGPVRLRKLSAIDLDRFYADLRSASPIGARAVSGNVLRCLASGYTPGNRQYVKRNAVTHSHVVSAGGVGMENDGGSMSTDLAMDTIRGCYEALARRDLGAFVALLADDCVMYEAGGPDIFHSGIYRGPGEITAVFQRLSELSDGSGSFELEDLFSDGAGAVVSVHRNVARRPDGRTLNTREALLFQVENGHVKAVSNFYEDMGEVARFWSN